MSGYKVRVGGAWKDSPAQWVKVGGVWKPVLLICTKVGGAWANQFNEVSTENATTGTYVGNGTNGTLGVVYRWHRWLGSGSLTVVKSVRTFDYLVVGGGGGGWNSWTPQNGNGGGGGNVDQRLAQTLGVATYPITIGAGGVGANFGNPQNGAPGGTTSFNGISCGGGNGADTFGGYGGAWGANAATYYIDGTGITYGAGGQGSTVPDPAVGSGVGGCGGTTGGNTGGPGASGSVTIRYVIAA